MWRFLTRIIGDEIYGYLERSTLLQKEQKCCPRGSRRTKDSFVNRQDHFEELQKGKEKSRHQIYGLQELYDIVPHSLLKKTLKTVRVASNIRRLLDQSMRSWKIVLTSNVETVGEVSIQRGIFQGDSFCPSLFIIIFIALFMTLNSTNYGYLLSKETPINHLLFMDDMKLHGKTERELQSLVH